MPPELLFLPFIESGYIGSARSKSGAAGLWQFMLNSVGSSMKVNDMIDERRDFRISTVAALRKLNENYRATGNWPMALAAYNAGLGAADRAAQRGKTSDYWILCEKKEFKTETIHYVPKLLAVSYILTQPRRFGIEYWPETVEWTVIKPGRQASLDIIAAETGADRNLLRRLNNELLYGITPPDQNYELKVPLSHADQITAILEKADSRLLHFYTYRIQYGDTLSALSRHYGVSVNLIEQHNPGILNRYLKIGEIILIPAFASGIAAPSPAAAQNQAASGAPAGGTGSAAARNGNAGSAAGRPFTGSHTVVQGDTLWSLAIRYQVDPQVLAAENNMGLNQILSIGRVLKVPIIE
jgi:membrane-bound lytic murein transglycosylase D